MAEWGRVMLLLIFLWGFSEASWFFIIPDVILSLFAIQQNSKKLILIANLICVAGAVAGGAVIYILSVFDYHAIYNFILHIPAVHEYMIVYVQNKMNTDTFFALLTGPLFGIPYKIFALEAHQYTSIFTFLLFTIPARLIRFILISFLAYYLSHFLFKNHSKSFKTLIWLTVWCIVYIIYFNIHTF